MPVKEQRDYLLPWLRIKERGAVTLRVAPHLVARVRKAIIKEKDMDKGFKLLQEGEGNRKKMLKTVYNAKTWEFRLELIESKMPSLSEL